MKLKEGQKAPAFSLLDENEDTHKLSDYKGEWVLLYFYPKDDTPGCTVEAVTIKDAYKDFKKKGITVLGVSIDPVKSHKKFKDKYKLPFTLLSDEDKKVVNKYGVWGKKKFMGREYMGTLRNSYLIDPKGKIARIYEKVTPKKHADEVLNDIEELS
ncbi:thioredoxin-dependent thiol peroxidase [bacterium]|nr:thioredoxin-dependent thiol peroxidase [bacterium]|tara:strand:+ start:11638 stop:12105 length:468 start_codon:yes stop_codon:yes gene_type:complete